MLEMLHKICKSTRIWEAIMEQVELAFNRMLLTDLCILKGMKSINKEVPLIIEKSILTLNRKTRLLRYQRTRFNSNMDLKNLGHNKHLNLVKQTNKNL